MTTPNRLKFRAWDTKNKKMYGPEHMLYLNYPITPEGSILMQSTGLLDKNGKEIFEGDIVSFLDDGNKTFLKEIKWRARIELEWGYSPTGFEVPDDYTKPRVIGNIYENPELEGKYW